AGTAVPAVCIGAGASPSRRARRRHLALCPPTFVDTVGLLGPRHPREVGYPGGMSPKRAIGVDLGGTKILAGVVDEAGHVHSTEQRETPTGSQDELLAALELSVRKLLSADIEAVGFGIPARVDQRSGLALGAVNIPLHELPLRQELERRLGLPIGIANDASAATLAESVHGAGRDS